MKEMLNKVSPRSVTAYGSVALAWIVYVILGMWAPSSNAIATYGIAPEQLVLIKVSLYIPVLLIWLLLVYGIIRVGAYTQTIRGSTDAKPFRLLYWGLMLMLLGLMASSFLAFAGSYGLVAASAIKIATGYANVVFSLAPFICIYLASSMFAADLKKHGKYVLPAVIVTSVLAVAFIVMVFSNPYRTISTNAAIAPVYGVPDALIVTTIVMPYVLAWLAGLVSVALLFDVKKNIKGIIYRKAFAAIANGLLVTVVISVCLQFLKLASDFLVGASLQIILGLVYGLLVAIGFGYLLIAKGAKQLSKIEEM